MYGVEWSGACLVHLREYRWGMVVGKFSRCIVSGAKVYVLLYVIDDVTECTYISGKYYTHHSVGGGGGRGEGVTNITA